METTNRAYTNGYERISRDQERETITMPATVHRSASQYSAQQQASDFNVITPLYKTHNKPNTEVTTGGGSMVDLSRKYTDTNGDYKTASQQESFRMQIIDPKVDSHAFIPAHGRSDFPRHKSLIDDFPSQHNKRSMLNLDAMEQRKIRSVETRPITTNAYLNESVDRHRAMEASKLREHLKTNEHDANKPWNKASYHEQNQNDESLRELEQIRKSIETLQKAASEPRKQNDDLDELARKNRELYERSRSRKQDFKIVESEIIKTEPDLLPPPQLKVETKPWPHMPATLRPVPDSPQSTMTRDLNENYSNYARRSMRYSSMPVLETEHESATRGTLIRLQDEKPRSIMKSHESQSREVVVSKPKVTETIQRVEERKRTEEIERRVLRRERRHKSHRSRYSHGHQEAIGWQNGGGTAHRSSSMSRGNYDSGYYGGSQYPTYNGNANGNGYQAGYNSGYNDGHAYNQNYDQHRNQRNYYNGYDVPPAYPRRTMSTNMVYY